MAVLCVCHLSAAILLFCDRNGEAHRAMVAGAPCRCQPFLLDCRLTARLAKLNADYLIILLAGSDYTFRCYLLALSLQTRVAGRLRVQDGKIRQENLLVPPLLLRTANERLHLWIRMGCLMRLLFKQGTDRRWRSLLVE